MEGSLASTLAGPGLNDGVRTPPLGPGGGLEKPTPSVVGLTQKKDKEER